MNPLDPTIAARLKRDGNGLVAAIIQQHDTHEVLMLGWMDDEALRRTLTTGRVTFFSRSRREYCVLAYDAVDRLTAAGRTARRLHEGMLEWRLAGLPVDDGVA